MKEAILERGVLDLDIVGKIKAPLESRAEIPRQRLLHNHRRAYPDAIVKINHIVVG